MLKHLDLSQFTLNEKMYIENANIQNCKISEIQNRICVISKCNFYNVEGEDLELLVKDNIFIDCVFENISYRSFQVQSNVTYSKFVNCNFSNIKMEGDLSFIGLEFQGGKIDNFNFYGNQIMQNIFLDLQIKDMNLNCAFIENRMERIDFKGTKISGYCRDNIFIECEPNGIMP